MMCHRPLSPPSTADPPAGPCSTLTPTFLLKLQGLRAAQLWQVRPCSRQQQILSSPALWKECLPCSAGIQKIWSDRGLSLISATRRIGVRLRKCCRESMLSSACTIPRGLPCIQKRPLLRWQGTPGRTCWPLCTVGASRWSTCMLPGRTEPIYGPESARFSGCMLPYASPSRLHHHLQSHGPYRIPRNSCQPHQRPSHPPPGNPSRLPLQATPWTHPTSVIGRSTRASPPCRLLRSRRRGQARGR